MAILNERQKKILHAVISEYVMTAEPVGSRTISKRYQVELSPASIRNVMSDLEELGYFTQPHTSSGRVPTHQAFRFFIEELAQFNQLDPGAETALRERTQREGDLRSLVTETSRVLSEFTRYAGVGFTSQRKTSTFRHIEFIRLERRQMLVVYVTQNNLVQNRLVLLQDDLRQSKLDEMANYLNSLLVGLTLNECRLRLIAEMKSERAQYDALLRQMVQVSQAVMADDESLVIEGGSNMLHAPEFGSIERMRALFRAFEEKNVIVRILDQTLESPGVHIYMGSEGEDDSLDNCAVVTGTYGPDAEPWGAIGVIGPMRMDYARVVPLVEYTSKLISRQIEQLKYEETGRYRR